jgi:hypothetical protein
VDHVLVSTSRRSMNISLSLRLPRRMSSESVKVLMSSRYDPGPDGHCQDQRLHDSPQGHSHELWMEGDWPG